MSVKAKVLHRNVSCSHGDHTLIPTPALMYIDSYITVHKPLNWKTYSAQEVIYRSPNVDAAAVKPSIHLLVRKVTTKLSDFT